MNRRLRLVMVSGIVVALLIIVFSIAYAKSVVVDGQPIDWVDSEQVYTNASPVAYGEVGISAIYVTNDTTNVYWRFDTISPTDWSEAGYFALCMDTLPLITATTGFGPCPASADYVLKLEPNLGTAEVWNIGTQTEIAATIDVATGVTVTEIAIDLASLDIAPGTNCSTGCDVPTSFRMDATEVFVTGDGAASAPADFEAAASGTGAWPITPRLGFNSPTAITLAEFNARIVNTQPFDWRVVAALGVLVAGLVVVRRVAN